MATASVSAQSTDAAAFAALSGPPRPEHVPGLQPRVVVQLSRGMLAEALEYSLSRSCRLTPGCASDTQLIICDAAHLADPAPPAARRILLAEPPLPPAAKILQAGVAGIVMLAEADLNQLLKVIDTVAAGFACLPYEIQRELLGQALQPPRQLSASLTVREAEVLALVAENLANKQIARRLHISIMTVKNHLHNIYEKLGVTGRREAVELTMHRGADS